MKRREKASDFLKRHGKDYSDANQLNVYEVEDFSQDISIPPDRRNFYQISLEIRCEGLIPML
jgi:hypothetical protein